MKLPTYKATPGLERFPEHERFRIYRATHKQLRRDNLSYRTQCRKYMVFIFAIATLPGIAVVYTPLIGTALFGFVTGASVIGMLVLALQQQRTMNATISAALPSQAGAVD